MQAYTQADLSRRFGLPQTLIRALGKAGYITQAPARGKTRYSFQDLLVLRMASALKRARISSARITAVLGQVKASVPPGQVLTTMALASSGKGIAVREGEREWEAPSGQYALPLASRRRANGVARLGEPESSAVALAERHYARGHALEDSDVAAARAAYLAALDAHAGHLEARINLGRLLHLEGDLKQAEKVYRQAQGSSALLSFNMAALFEDLHREEEAIVKYREALALDPGIHDAHFNLARLLEKAQLPREALRHLLAYRRHLGKFQG
jgi:tetratricopeptide (TPR) repeat protein